MLMRPAVRTNAKPLDFQKRCGIIAGKSLKIVSP